MWWRGRRTELGGAEGVREDAVGVGAEGFFDGVEGPGLEGFGPVLAPEPLAEGRLHQKHLAEVTASFIAARVQLRS